MTSSRPIRRRPGPSRRRNWYRFILQSIPKLLLTLNSLDTGESKKKLALSLGAEKWVDFKESKDLIADVQAATGGPGPQAAIIVTPDVSPQPVGLVISSFEAEWWLSAASVLASCDVLEEHWNTYGNRHAQRSCPAEYSYQFNH